MTRGGTRLTFAVLALAIVAYGLLQSMMTPILSLLRDEFSADEATVTWVITAFFLSAGIATPILGRLGDAFGKERMLVVALLALALGSIVAAVAPTIGVMIAARAVQGICGGVLPLSFGIVRDEFEPDDVAGAVGLLSSTLAAAGGAGTVLAGPIVDALGFRWLFGITGIASLVSGLLGWRFVPTSPVRTSVRVNWGAAALLASWLVALLVGISAAPGRGWSSLPVLVLLGLGVVGGACWVFIESRSESPLIDMAMMRRRTVWAPNLVALFVGLAMYTMFAFVPTYLQAPRGMGYGFGADIARSGLMVLPQSVVSLVLGVAAGRLTARYGSRMLLLTGTLIAVLSPLAYATMHSSVWQVILASAILGSGIGLAFAALGALVVNSVPPEQTGTASGMNANLRTIGGAIGAAVASTLLGKSVGRTWPTQAAFDEVFALVGGAFMAAALAVLLVPPFVRRADEASADQCVVLRPAP